MNKGFSTYFKMGYSSAYGTIKREKINIFKFYLINICSLLARIGIVTYPLGKLLKIRTNQMVAKEERIDVYNAFRSVDRPKSYIESFFYMICVGLLYLAGFILFGLIGGLFVTLAYVISSDVDMFTILGIALGAPAALGLIIYTILLIIYFRPGWYIIDNNPQMCTTGIIYNSNQAMKHGGKITTIMIDVLHYIIKLLFLAITAGCTSAFFIYFPQELFTPIYAIVSGLLIIIIYPFLSMAHGASLAHFYNDIKIIFPSYEYDTSMNDRKVAKGKGHLKLKGSNKESVLLSLFDSEPTKLEPTVNEDPSHFDMPEDDFVIEDEEKTTEIEE